MIDVTNRPYVQVRFRPSVDVVRYTSLLLLLRVVVVDVIVVVDVVVVKQQFRGSRRGERERGRRLDTTTTAIIPSMR